MKENLILLHGALGSAAQFQMLADLLKDHFTIHTFNFSGHGGKDIPQEFSIDLFVKDTMDYMQAHHLEKTGIFGYSMGGYVALQLALHHPGRAERIMTLGTKFLWNPDAAAKEVRMMNPDIIEQKVPKFAEILAERHAPADWKIIMRKTADMMTLLGNGEAMTTQDFHRIPHNVLVCIGSDDHMVSIHESSDTANALQLGKLKIIEGFKHPLEAVDQTILGGIIHDFFE